MKECERVGKLLDPLGTVEASWVIINVSQRGYHLLNSRYFHVVFGFDLRPRLFSS